MDISADDLLSELRVSIEVPAKKKAELKVRHTRWNDPPPSQFTFGGYLAKVNRIKCLTCDHIQDELIGIFTEEVDRNGGRRLTQLSRKADWPANEEHRYEVSNEPIPYCCKCLPSLGFSEEVMTPPAISIKIPSGDF